jgi:hypothetical protein
MTEKEVMDALIAGAVIRVSDSGDVDVVTLNDLPPNVRECYRASRQRDRAHQDACPDRLESEAEATLMDVASHRKDGNEAIALELEAEADKLRSRAANFRSTQQGGMMRRSPLPPRCGPNTNPTPTLEE